MPFLCHTCYLAKSSRQPKARGTASLRQQCQVHVKRKSWSFKWYPTDEPNDNYKHKSFGKGGGGEVCVCMCVCLFIHVLCEAVSLE